MTGTAVMILLIALVVGGCLAMTGYKVGKVMIALATVVAVIAIIVTIAYKIAVSDLPDWFKFWLLKDL